MEVTVGITDDYRGDLEESLIEERIAIIRKVR